MVGKGIKRNERVPDEVYGDESTEETSPSQLITTIDHVDERIWTPLTGWVNVGGSSSEMNKGAPQTPVLGAAATQNTGAGGREEGNGSSSEDEEPTSRQSKDNDVILIQVILLLSYFSTDRFNVIFSFLLFVNIVILKQ